MRLSTFDNSEIPGVYKDFGPKVERPCECGCDERDGASIGYLHIARNGIGFVIHAENEDEFELLKEVIQ